LRSKSDASFFLSLLAGLTGLSFRLLLDDVTLDSMVVPPLSSIDGQAAVVTADSSNPSITASGKTKRNPSKKKKKRSIINIDDVTDSSSYSSEDKESNNNRTNASSDSRKNSGSKVCTATNGQVVSSRD
jgi:hypothetical protein